jgi:hypothetical protein
MTHVPNAQLEALTAGQQERAAINDKGVVWEGGVRAQVARIPGSLGTSDLSQSSCPSRDASWACLGISAARSTELFNFRAPFVFVIGRRLVPAGQSTV